MLKKTSMSIQELIDGERTVKSSLLDVYGWPLTEKIVEDRLSLIVEKTSLADNLEAQLIPDDHANGRILLNEKYTDDEEFDYLHEVIHYFRDVGIGKKVNKTYSRLRTGNSNDLHEREIDYLTSVALIPGNELLKRIEQYRNNWYKMDELEFMKTLEHEFKCSEACLQKRLRDVHCLRRHKLLPIRTENLRDVQHRKCGHELVALMQGIIRRI